MTKVIPGLWYSLLSEDEKLQVENFALYKMQEEYARLMEKFSNLNPTSTVWSEHFTEPRQTQGLEFGEEHNDLQVLIRPNNLSFRSNTSHWTFDRLVQVYWIWVGLDIIKKLKDVVG